MFGCGVTHAYAVIGTFPGIGKMAGEVDLPPLSEFIRAQNHRPDAKGLRSSVAIFSRARYGKADFGTNRKRVLAWLDRLRGAIGQ